MGKFRFLIGNLYYTFMYSLSSKFMKNPCKNCPDKTESYHCAKDCEKRHEYWQSIHEPWMATEPTPSYTADDTHEATREELEPIMKQLRAFPDVWGGGQLK
jgi:hypothetical protein